MSTADLELREDVNGRGKLVVVMNLAEKEERNAEETPDGTDVTKVGNPCAAAARHEGFTGRGRCRRWR